jgi:hypothetical protein
VVSRAKVADLLVYLAVGVLRGSSARWRVRGEKRSSAAIPPATAIAIPRRTYAIVDVRWRGLEMYGIAGIAAITPLSRAFIFFCFDDFMRA